MRQLFRIKREEKSQDKVYVRSFTGLMKALK
jgi:hypothetical protein